MRYDLIIKEPDPLLKNLAKRLKIETLNSRNLFEKRINSIKTQVESIHRKNDDLCSIIFQLKAQINLHTHGVAATEVRHITGLNSEPEQQVVANAFLLKKAYRTAASLAHPDKGGSHDDFLAVSAAYRANNIESLNEYVLARNRDLLDQIHYWDSERLKPKINYTIFQSSNDFKVAVLQNRGEQQAASELSRAILEHTIFSLRIQLDQLLKEIYNGNQNANSIKENNQDSTCSEEARSS
jgi:hypothetical protein